LNYQQLLKDPKHAKVWAHSAANEFGRLAQVVGTRIKGTNTIHFIRETQVPQERARDVTYGSFSCNFKPNKEEKERTRLTAGGDRINYPGDNGTPTTDMTLVKIIMNSVISTKGARCMMVDLKDFYLNMPVPASFRPGTNGDLLPTPSGDRRCAGDPVLDVAENPTYPAWHPPSGASKYQCAIQMRQELLRLIFEYTQGSIQHS